MSRRNEKLHRTFKNDAQLKAISGTGQTMRDKEPQVEFTIPGLAGIFYLYYDGSFAWGLTEVTKFYPNAIALYVQVQESLNKKVKHG